VFMALPKQNLEKKERQSKRGYLVLFSTIFNKSDLLVDMLSRVLKGAVFLKDKIKTEE
jgi:hypothetical protein